MKRIFDVVASLILIFIFIVPFFLLLFIVWFKLGAPIFFTQIRSGLNGKPFKLIKFRSMTNEFSSDGKLLSDDLRLDSFGLWLRATSLDEIPEIWNVIKGDMSLVGPRPLLMEYLSLYTDDQFRRHNVKPGITGWAQINGRNGIDWNEKFLLDIWYVDNHNIWLDLRILFITIKKVLLREGISSTDQVSMPKFTGTVGSDK